MSAPELVLERSGPILLVRLNRPDARNALTSTLLADLGAAVLAAETDPETRAVVLTGTGDRAFCAGMDLHSFASGAPAAEPDEDVQDAVTRLFAGRTTIPVVGAANGTAIGGGLELLLGCDVVVASEQARFGFPEVKRGLFPAGGGTFLGTRVPMALALELILTGDLVDAARAREIGLVNTVSEAGAVLSTAMDCAERIAENAPLGLAAAKELVRLGVTDHAAATDRLQHWQSVVFASADAKEGATAFVEKRKPVWEGR